MNPGGILGTRWMTFLYAPNGNYGIHGTNNPASIGTAASKGCIRLHNHSVEALFPKVPLGTPVLIQKQAWQGQVGQSPGSSKVYIVKPGDTLWKIAQAHNTTVDQILAINKIVNPTAIYPGQQILIP